MTNYQGSQLCDVCHAFLHELEDLVQARSDLAKARFDVHGVDQCCDGET